MPTLRELFRNRADGTDVITDGAGSSIVGYSFEQTSATNVWVVRHLNNSTILGVQVYINSELVEPDDITIVDSNAFEVSFSEPVVGFVNFLLFTTLEGVLLATPTPTVSLSLGITPTSTPSGTPTPTPTSIND